MGAGASAGISAALEVSSPEDLQTAIGLLESADRQKLLAALGAPSQSEVSSPTPADAAPGAGPIRQEWSGVGRHDGRWQERKYRIDSPRGAYSNYALEIFANQTGACGTIQLGRIQFLDADEREIPWERIDVNSERCHGGEKWQNLQAADRGKWCTQLEYFPDNTPRFEFTFPQPVTVATLVFTSADDAPERDPSRFSLSSSSSVNAAACLARLEADRAKQMQTAELSYKAQAVAELQKKGMWVGVLPEEATLAMLHFYNMNAGILTLAPPQDSDASRVVVKISRVPKGEASTILSCHLALSEHGVAVPLLAHTLDFTVESEAKSRPHGFSDTLPGFVDNAGVTARLHRAPTTWFDGQCREVLQDYVPLLKEEPLNSALYVAAAHQRSRGIPKEDMPQSDKLRELMAVLPRPVGLHAERLVVVHGDLWEGNILHMPDGRTVLCDFEQTVVSSAVQDLVHVSMKPLVAAYLEQMIGAEPSEAEVYQLLLEARIAEHIHFYVIRDLFFGDKPGNIDELIEHSRLFGFFATKLRDDPTAAKKLLDVTGDCAWREDMIDMMQKL